MKNARFPVLLALAVMLAPHVEASRTSVWKRNPPSALTTTKTDAAGLLASLAPSVRLDQGAAATAETTKAPLFDLGDVVLAESALEREERFGIGPLELLSPAPLRGPPPSYPETRVGGFERLPPFRVGASASLSLWGRQACGAFSCGLASDSRYDPWGLRTFFTADVGPGDVLPTLNMETGNTAVDAVLGVGNNLFNLAAKFVNAGMNFGKGAAVVQDKVDEKAWEKGIACRGCTSFGIEMAGALSGTREAQSAFKVLGDYGRALGARPPPKAAPPIAGETESTRIGREAHGGFAEADRASGLFSEVSSPITDKAGRPIQVPKRVDLKTGQPQPGTSMQEAVPDAVSYDRFELVLDYKPLGRPIAKDRQEIIRFIKAYEAREGRLPKRVAIPRYDPRTGDLLKTDLFAPGDFLPK